jgi:hypothetical protein
MCSYLIQLLWHPNSHSYSAINCLLVVNVQSTLTYKYSVKCGVVSCSILRLPIYSDKSAIYLCYVKTLRFPILEANCVFND